MNWVYVVAAVLVFALMVGALMGFVYGEARAFAFGVMMSLGVVLAFSAIGALLFLGLKDLE